MSTKIPKEMLEELRKNGFVDTTKYTLEYYQAKEALQKEKMRGYYLKKKYGTTADEYLKLFEQQKGLCAICKTAQPQKRLAIDHDHKTGKNRGLLCTRCNFGVGYFLDNPVLLKDAAEYIISHIVDIDIVKE